MIKIIYIDYIGDPEDRGISLVPKSEATPGLS
jgi:hypothetical protein